MEKKSLMILIVLGFAFIVLAMVIDRYASNKSLCDEWSLEKRYVFLYISAFFVCLGFSSIITGIKFINTN